MGSIFLARKSLIEENHSCSARLPHAVLSFQQFSFGNKMTPHSHTTTRTSTIAPLPPFIVLPVNDSNDHGHHHQLSHAPHYPRHDCRHRFDLFPRLVVLLHTENIVIVIVHCTAILNRPSDFHSLQLYHTKLQAALPAQDPSHAVQMPAGLPEHRRRGRLQFPPELDAVHLSTRPGRRRGCRYEHQPQDEKI